MTKLTYGIVGHPVKHSLSPVMQGAAFAEAGIDAEYLLYDVAPDELDDFLASMSGRGIAGLNVTIPYKIKAKEHIERNGRVDDNAKKLGAVNTIKAGPDGLEGFNTDGPGFYKSLVEDLRFEPEGKRVFVLGSGGAAKAIVMYLGDGPSAIAVYDIDTAKASDLERHYAETFRGRRIEVVSDARSIEKAVESSDLLVNATPVGMGAGDPSPVDKALLHPGLYVYDLVYNRPYTRLVKEASSLKLHAVTGLGTLLYQGAIAFEVWTGRKAPVAAMRRALKDAFKG
jgi:shikimate dehydrogenase